ncbi:MAG: hypothetical protein R2733_03390 [Acidimicrobiales bacterium]
MHWEYVIPGYLIVFLSLAAYSLYVVRKGRSLSEQLPPEKRRFLD